MDYAIYMYNLDKEYQHSEFIEGATIKNEILNSFLNSLIM